MSEEKLLSVNKIWFNRLQTCERDFVSPSNVKDEIYLHYFSYFICKTNERIREGLF